MRTLVVNPANGVAGDMLMAGLAHATGSATALAGLLEPLTVRGWCTLDLHEVTRSSVRALRCEVKLGRDAPVLSLEELRWWVTELMGASQGAEIALRALDLLGESEEEVHGGGIHLHELASVDTLADLVGVAHLCTVAGIDAVSIMPVGVRFGAFPMAHGQLPLPGPAVASLLARAGLTITATPGAESVTPTGAALLAALAQVFPQAAAIGTIDGVGYGAGGRDIAGLANVCQVMVLADAGVGFARATVESVGVIETYLDDVSGEALGAFVEESLSAGALDAYLVPATGKKSRPGVLLTVLVNPIDVDRMVEKVQRALATPGVRFRLQQRQRLIPRFVEVYVENRAVTVKVTSAGAKPEFEDLRRVSGETGIPIGELHDRVMARFRGAESNV